MKVEFTMVIVLEIIRRFMSVDPDDVASEEDLEAERKGRLEYAAGETIPMSDIDWS